MENQHFFILNSFLFTGLVSWPTLLGTENDVASWLSLGIWRQHHGDQGNQTMGDLHMIEIVMFVLVRGNKYSR